MNIAIETPPRPAARVAWPTSGSVLVGEVTVSPSRRYEVDWLRVVATALVFLYHSSRFFDAWGWHIKNDETPVAMSVYSAALDQVIMPLFFVLSGISVWYALEAQRRSFFLERVNRLLVPLLLGIAVLGPPMIYAERLTHHQFSGSFVEWLPSYLDGMYGFGGNFAWMGVHLWYLEILFLYSMLALPFLVYLRGQRGQQIISGLVAFLRRPGMIFAPALVLALAEYAQVLDPEGLGRTTDFGGWNLLVYLILFFYGFLFLVNSRLREVIAGQRRVALGAAVLLMPATLALIYVRETGSGSPLLYVALAFVRTANVWAWILALLGLGIARLDFSNRTLKYANEAVLPFYILHQPVIMFFGFFIVQWDLPVLAKYLLVMATALPTILLMYELLVRRVGVLRFLFGMKPGKRGQVPTSLRNGANPG